MFQFERRASLYQRKPHNWNKMAVMCSFNQSTIPCDKIKAGSFSLKYFIPISGFFKEVRIQIQTLVGVVILIKSVT